MKGEREGLRWREQKKQRKIEMERDE